MLRVVVDPLARTLSSVRAAELFVRVIVRLGLANGSSFTIIPGPATNCMSPSILSSVVTPLSLLFHRDMGLSLFVPDLAHGVLREAGVYLSGQKYICVKAPGE